MEGKSLREQFIEAVNQAKEKGPARARAAADRYFNGVADNLLNDLEKARMNVVAVIQDPGLLSKGDPENDFSMLHYACIGARGAEDVTFMDLAKVTTDDISKMSGYARIK